MLLQFNLVNNEIYINIQFILFKFLFLTKIIYESM